MTHRARALLDYSATMGGLRSGVEHLLEHTAVIAGGIVLIVIGLAMTYSLVLGVPGVIVLVIGVAFVIGGFIKHPSRRARIKQS